MFTLSEKKDVWDRFDEISNGFEKGDATVDPSISVAHNENDNEAEYSPSEAGRLDRLSATRSKGGSSVAKQLGSVRDRIPFLGKRNGTNTGDSMTKKKKSRRKKRYKVNIKRILLILFLLVVLAAGAAGIWALDVIRDTPRIEADNIYTLLSENSVLYDDAGNELENIFSAGAGLRTNLNFTQMPENLVDAFVAIEDKTFWEHKGFNFVRIVGAIVDGFRSGDSIRGTSTITQQLARNLYLEDTKSLRSMERKLKEAYYAVQLERQLSKEQIVEAYMNTIYLGSGANGVQAASQTYFSKDVDELTLAECAVLAAVPKSPNQFSPIKRLDNADITDPDSLDFLYRGETFSIWYQADYVDRQLLVLQFMQEQGYIDDVEYQEAVSQDIRASVNPNIDASLEISTYFADYVVAEVIEDLMFEYDVEEEVARNMLYNGGLRIHSTLNVNLQKIAEAEFAKNANFPTVTGLNKDKAGNARDVAGKILMHAYSNMFNEEGNFTLPPAEFRWNEDGSMTVFKGNRLNIFKTEVKGVVDYSIEFKPMYRVEEGIFYAIPGGYLLIPAEYKDRDQDGNLVLTKEFFEEKSTFQVSGESIVVAKDYYQLKEKVIQPQAAMVIFDYKTGGIKAMAGGRSLSGKLLFNRAISPRQPGSAIKPMGVYGPALQRSVDMVANGGANGAAMWTAASVIDDAPLVLNGKLWPKNWYNGYRGLHTLRQSVEQSINVNAVKTFLDIGPATSVAFLKKLGVTSVVESGSINDMNPAALALGGMTQGISPLQMTAGYSAFANQGIYTEPVSYTTVTNKKGEILLEGTPKREQAMDRGVAFLVTDILRTTITDGIAKSAAIGSSPVAGKTGTTSDNFDAWFVGVTPHYAAALWIGNDSNLELSQGSIAAARLWSKIMKQVHVGLPAGTFPTADNIISVTIDTKSGKLPSELSALDPRGTVRNEFFVKGTEPVEIDDVHVYVTVCADSGDLVTPFCPNPVTQVRIRRPEGSVIYYEGVGVADSGYGIPQYYCNLHNLDPVMYPIDPSKTLDTTFVLPGTPPGLGEDEVPPEDDGNGNNGNGNNSGTDKPEWLN